MRRYDRAARTIGVIVVMAAALGCGGHDGEPEGANFGAVAQTPTERVLNGEVESGDGERAGGTIDTPLVSLMEVYPGSNMVDLTDTVASLGWFELKNTSARPIDLNGWSIEVDGVRSDIVGDGLLESGHRLVVDAQSQLNATQATVRLLAPNAAIIDEAIVPVLSDGVAWVKLGDGWQVGFPTPGMDNRYWARPTVHTYKMRIPRVLFSGREAGLDSVRTILANRAPLQKDAAASRFFSAADLDTDERGIENAGQGTHLTYRARLGALEELGEFVESAGELSLAFTKPDETLSVLPVVLAPTGVDYSYARETQTSVCGTMERFFVRAHLVGTTTGMDVVQDVLGYFPGITIRMPRIQRGRSLERYDVEYQVERCHGLELGEFVVPICIQLAYGSMGALDTEGELPDSASIQWSLSDDMLNDPDVRQQSAELFRWLTESDLNVEVCSADAFD